MIVKFPEEIEYRINSAGELWVNGDIATADQTREFDERFPGKRFRLRDALENVGADPFTILWKAVGFDRAGANWTKNYGKGMLVCGFALGFFAGILFLVVLLGFRAAL